MIVKGNSRSVFRALDVSKSVFLFTAWGYTILAVLIISAFSLLSVPMARWQNSPMFKYILTVMLALAVGTLAGDAIMHLIPHVSQYLIFFSGQFYKGSKAWQSLYLCLKLKSKIFYFGYVLGSRGFHKKGPFTLLVVCLAVTGFPRWWNHLPGPMVKLLSSQWFL